jgi:hypothetical protein
MSVAAATRRAQAAVPGRATLTDRLLAAVPLASVYAWLCIVYCFEAWKRVTPWLFTDELELTQLSRSIAATGHAARRGEPHSFRSLYTVITAPVWWIHDVAVAYSTLKYVDVFVMTSVVFPTYFLARMVVGRRWALFAAAGAAMAPALAYSSWIIEETLAYPYAALCFFLVAKAFVTRSRWWTGGAVVAAAAAPAVRGEFVVIDVMLGLALLFAAWSSDWARRRRESWSFGDWLGAVAIAAGAIIVVGGFMSWHSTEWLEVTAYNWTKHRALVYGNWAAGGLAIGLGLIPLVAGVASLFPARGEIRTRELRMFRCIAVAAIVVFAVYTGFKAGYLSMHFATRVWERNLIFITPVLFVGTAIVLERRRVNFYALGAAAVYAFYLVVGTPFQMGVQLTSDSLGFAILQAANRYYAWTPDMAQWLLIAILALGVVLLIAASLGRIPRVAGAAAAAVLAVGLLAWNMTGEISAAAGTVSISRDLETTLKHPFTWVDDGTRGKPTIYLAQGVGDPNPEWLLEFWNRSITFVGSLDGTLGGPGPSGAPNITPTGQLYWTADPANPGRLFDYAVEDWPCVDFAGTLAGRHFYRSGADKPGEWRLMRLTKPNRLRAACLGIYPDGWSGANDSTYYRFSGQSRGWLRISLARGSWPPSPVRVQLATIGVRDRYPTPGRVLRERRSVVPTQKLKVIWLPVPASGFAVRTVVERKFIPRDVDPHLTDPRILGAQVSYRFFTKLPPYARR